VYVNQTNLNGKLGKKLWGGKQGAKQKSGGAWPTQLPLRIALGPDQSHYNQSRLWSRLQTTLAKLHGSAPSEYKLSKIFSPFTIFEQLALVLKKQSCPIMFTVLNSLFTFRIFNSLNLPWKLSFPEIFHCIDYIFYHSGILSNCACPEKQSSPVNCIEYILPFRSFEQLAFVLKNGGCAEFTVLNIYFLSLRIFEQLALALKKQSCPEILLY